MASPILERELPVDSYTDFRHPQPSEQSGLMACCSPATLLTLPSGFEQGQQLHQPDTCSFTPAVCALPQQQHQGQQDFQDPQGAQLLSPPTCCSDASLYMSPYLSYQPTIQNIWPSPPLLPGDIQSCISFEDSPICGSVGLPFYNSSEDNSPTSPGGWSSVSGYPPTTGFFPQQHPGDQAFGQVCTPMSAQDAPYHHSDMSTPYTESFHLDSDAELSAGLNMSVSSSDMMQSLSAAPPSSSVGSPEGLQAETPASLVVPKIEIVDQQEAGFMDSILAAPNAADPVPANSVGSDEKNDEPYAKLIYKALMSRPDYTMTLQELYQWFRDNTNKAKNEKGGWQNSIRHNLSMNAAFKRRDRKRGDGTAASTCVEDESPLAGDAKRANEWVLEDWAVRDGVQSTTRYRKGNSGRRSSRRNSGQLNLGSGISMRRSSQRSSVKALSGQKGGCAARNARARSQMYSQELSLADGRQYRLIESGLGSPPASSMPDGFYSMPIAIPRIDPTAIQTPGAHGADFGSADTATDLFGLQMTGPRMDQPVAGDDAVSYMGQQEHMYAAFPYELADVHLDYSGDVADQIRRYDSMTGTPRMGWATPHGM
ncbi:uncharacterized protein TRIVIDRAFT_224971 [Trichoderma virens Gv29-8]|uniref:Fork-head domain-containing protein n=1 Tax=Hypocrea virens (strain Gv29-8 / FGSC 10586) TaxID=413071 RepID=G9N1Y3_HYPVG|nr:uncharacterized protein TRIVIDRAFT_224971 [Trichoderma virens Gv29-8]EHK19100.1 hypothetical protein TRIVIDRAFT_224971 [Trichoderma virens Gv29-8]UKZ49449.1 hypothetical protein TrVGV298_003696 [Trichoderma virens]